MHSGPAGRIPVQRSIATHGHTDCICTRTGCFRRTRRCARSRAGCTRRSRDLPILSPHGHTDPQWFATNAPFTNATELLLAPDHYLYRMLYSQGIDLDALGVPFAPRAVDSAIRARRGGCSREHFHLFRRHALVRCG